MRIFIDYSDLLTIILIVKMRISFFAMGAALMAYSNALKVNTQEPAFETAAFFNGFAETESMQDTKAATPKPTSDPIPTTKTKPEKVPVTKEKVPAPATKTAVKKPAPIVDEPKPIKSVDPIIDDPVLPPKKVKVPAPEPAAPA